jgi:vacuolar-type H+-ATPase subunit F/Vma7
LKSIGDSEFVGGLQLAGDQLFFQAQPGKGGFASVEAVLTQAGISAAVLQKSTTGKLTWYVARVTGVSSPTNIPAGDLSTPQLLSF